MPTSLLFNRAVKALDRSLKTSLNGDRAIQMRDMIMLTGSCKRVLKEPEDDVFFTCGCEEVLVVLTGLPSSFSVS